MAALSYMAVRGSTQWFRKRLPEALAGKDAPEHIRAAFPQLVNAKTGRFKLEVTNSLKTKDEATAKRRSLKLASAVSDDIAAALRMYGEGSLTDASLPELPSVEEFEAAYFRRELEMDQAERRSGDPMEGLHDREALGLLPREATEGMQRDHFLAWGDLLEIEAADLRDALARQDPSVIRGDIEAAFHRLGLRFDPKDPTHRDRALAILGAAADAVEAKLDRQSGKRVKTPEPAPPAQGPKFSEAFDHWKRPSTAKGGRQLAPNSLREAALAVRLFKEWAGDKALGAITKEDTRTFRDALERRPTGLPAKLRALPLRDLLEKDLRAYPPTSATTVNKLLNMLKAVVRRAEKDGLTDGLSAFANPFKDVRSDVDERQAEGREPFDNADLKALFETPVFASGVRPAGGGGEAAFWLPVLALLTGARQEELAQLRVCDIGKDVEAGVWFLDIGISGGRNVKTVSSRRKVPLHPELERIGLLRYREARAKNNPSDAPLWPDIKSDVNGKRSAAWSKWFGRYLRDTAGVKDQIKVFHSFRHTFKRLARSAHLTEEMHDALTGHAGGSGVGRSYGKGFDLQALSEGVAKIAAPARCLP
ncbi:site-specific integrase [Chenggangzhangella methanolivorans]|uniref:Site-specific integrase n=1 Tax=Chenggangzhangella methanolivorans TaxID=1437009 RepID=A0A9E6RCH4_9HYPH|nr:site-specific integrase [Chenggangzhangella methanolivorans]QZN98251.1 site-specific integrase [Chenggangzhangella methanolivorans]